MPIAFLTKMEKIKPKRKLFLVAVVDVPPHSHFCALLYVARAKHEDDNFSLNF